MRKLLSVLTVSSFIVLLIVGHVSAHTADMYLHTHIITLAPDGLHATWEIAPGPMLAHILWYNADRNEDDVVSAAEARAWADGVWPSFTATFDGAPLALELTGIEWPSEIPALLSGEEPIRLALTAAWVIGEGEAHTLTFDNAYDPQNSLVWFDVLAEDDLVLDVPAQDGGQLTLAFQHTTAETAATALTAWESGRPNVPWVVESLGLDEFAESADAPQTAQTGAAAVLEGLVRKQSSSPGFVLAALGIALLLGSLHALSPGHGKTIVAAYLVGAQGKFYHAIILGALVTITHTGTVFTMGLLTLTAARYLVDVDVFPLLEVASGVLILVLGIGLLLPRVRSWYTYRQRERRRKNAPPVTERDAVKGTTRVRINQPIEEIGPAHTHAPGTIPRAPVVGKPLAEITWRSLITLGISGGLVPCPDAIAILLIAVTINRVAFGLALIVTFSLGLAAVLIVIGSLIVQGKRLFARLRWFDRVAYAVPVASAVVVLALGLALTVSAVQNLSASAPSSGGAPAPSFDLRKAQIAYAGMDEDGLFQLFVTRLPDADAGLPPTQLTHEAEGIWNYTVSPDLATLIYVTTEGMTNSRLWQWHAATGERVLLLECTDAFCSDVVWVPGGRRILYSRLEFDPDTGAVGLSTLWWLDVATGETASLFQDTQIPAINARWSPDGTKLSYTVSNPQAITVYDMQTGARHAIDSVLGYPAEWSPASDALLFVDLEPIGEANVYRLFHYDLAGQTRRPLDGTMTFDDDDPAWSPDGEWVAVVRTPRDAAAGARGSQIWRLRPDGSEAQQLTDDNNVFHSRPLWSPDGRYLLYGVTPGGGRAPYMCIFEVRTGDVHVINIPGNRPAWVLKSRGAEPPR